MGFENDSNEPINISVPRGRKDLTEPEVRAIMNGIIELGVVVTDKGSPSTIKSAEVRTTTMTRVA